MVHNPGGDWHPGKGDNPSCTFYGTCQQSNSMEHPQVCTLLLLKHIHELIPSPPSMRFGGDLTTPAHCSENMTIDA